LNPTRCQDQNVGAVFRQLPFLVLRKPSRLLETWNISNNEAVCLNKLIGVSVKQQETSLML